MRKIIWLLLFFVLGISFAFGDIFDDVENSKYSPMLKWVYNKYFYCALIIQHENGRTTWRSRFSEQEDIFLFSDLFSKYENKSVLDYVENLNIPYESLKTNILPDFTWYDNDKKLVGDTYWDPDLKIFVTYIWRYQNKLLTQPYEDEAISRNDLSNLLFFNHKMLTHIKYINNTINNKYNKNYKYIYFYYDSLEYDEDDGYTYSIYYGQNTSYEYYQIQGVNYRYTHVYLTDIDNSQEQYRSFCSNYKKYNMQNAIELKQFWVDYRNALSDSFIFKNNISFEIININIPQLNVINYLLFK